MPEKRFIPSRQRRSGLRDAKLIIIAAEGTNTEKRYFEDLANEYYTSRIHVEVLERFSTASDPHHILALLDSFCHKYAIRRGYDELWLVIDVDRWRDKLLSEISTLCSQKNYYMAVSNPCFEIWLLVHLKSLGEYDENTLEEFRVNKGTENRTRLDIELARLLGYYNKSNLDTAPFLPRVERAISEARRLDVHPEHRWPIDLGSRIYLLAENIIRIS